MMLEFIVKTSEEELLLAGGLDGRDEFGGIAIDEAIGGSHVEDEFAAYEFGGGVIDIGADESPMYGRYLLSGTALRA